ncbi:transcriptional regulator, TetR family [Thermomonospora curvata DSM 43183]|uniref:Transcriptional regulator, TetR family n=1 Tax=Thermomonospora curvata (strain ATCC 19995 / DSM 43183 / JCM 3096 / KCTC 9072 / NBRC 15933 / NCIMB 10081 / Henssen B9) TaxID=471852 RepID=D1ABA4_THECD|nr:transcriptional regulator, TetR family [Thermomonospora curvata DSM 43183]PKK15003.1 MAG: TetR/AcrR family transcriptional regulator [Thermomonospora sp. CIF 1]
MLVCCTPTVEGVSVNGRRRYHRRHTSRRTQEERRSATQARLLDATAEALADLGWAGLSTTEVSRRAGVSRGAQQHHYPTKMSLVAAALEHLLSRLRAEYEQAYAELPEEQRNIEGALDLFWEMLRQPPAIALLELALAGRTDESLRDLSADLHERVIVIIKEVFHELFPESLPPEIVDTTIRGLFALLVGLSIQNSLDNDVHGHQAAVLALVKDIAHMLIPDDKETRS